MYQYLLGKVSTDDEKEEYYRFVMYQYLLGKVSTLQNKKGNRKANRVSISIR